MIFNNILKPADFKRWLMYEGMVSKGGIKKALKFNDQIARSNKWEGSKKGSMKRFLIELNQSPKIATSSELVEELDLAIANSKTCKFLIS